MSKTLGFSVLAGTSLWEGRCKESLLWEGRRVEGGEGGRGREEEEKEEKEEEKEEKEVGCERKTEPSPGGEE